MSAGAVGDHLEVCADCRAYADGLATARRRQREALAALPRRRAPEDLARAVASAWSAESRETRAIEALGRLDAVSAPASLDGRVVAALQAGSRQERALRHLGQLESRSAPADLADRALEGVRGRPVSEGSENPAAGNPGDVLSAPPSPAVLERLVGEDLADLPRAMTRRFTGKLTRLEAPAELERRVRADLSRSTSDPRDAAPGGSLLRGRFGPAAGSTGWWVAAAGVALVLGALGWAGFGPGGDGERREGPELASLSFEVRRIEPGTALGDDAVDPFAKQLAREFGGARLGVAPRTDADGLADPLASEDGVPAPEDGEGDGTPPEDGTSPEGGASAPEATPGTPGANGGTGIDTSALQRAPSFSRDLLARMEQAPFLPVRMERRVEWYDAQHDALELAFEETVLRDGTGAYAVRADDVLFPTMSPAEEATFLLLQSGRQGYVERHRDFRVRDRSLFLQNYSVIDLRQPVVVAGRECVSIEVQSRIDGVTAWRLAVDPRTGLVLREERIDDAGVRTGRITVLQLDELPDLSAEVLDGGPSAWTPADATALAGYDLYVPGQMPPGYLPVDTARRIDALGREWVRRRYTDGLAELFLLHELKPTATIQQRLASNNAGKDVVNSFAVGGVQVLDGDVRGVRVIALGRLQEFDLLQWIDTAL